MARTEYRPSKAANADAARIEAWYKTLPDGDETKALIDNMARVLVRNCQPERLHPGMQGLGEMGARELVVKLAIWADGQPEVRR